MWFLFLLSLLPLALFVLIDYYGTLKSGVIAAIVSSAVLGCVYWYVFGEIDYGLVGIVIAISITGYISIKKQDGVWLKFQPVISNIIIIGIIAWYQFFDTPLMIKYLPKMAELLDPEKAALFAAPEMQEMLVRSTLIMMVLVAIHTVCVGFAALKLKTGYWLLIKSLGAPFVVLGVALVEMIAQII